MRTYIVAWKGRGEDDALHKDHVLTSECFGEDTPGLDGPVEDTTFTLQTEEITEGRFWSIREIQDHIGTGILTPNFEQEFDRYLRWRAQQRRTG